MKIISGFKDYYDYVSYIYGGGDPKLVYLRTKVADCKEPGNNTLRYDFSGHIPYFPKLKHKDVPWAFKWCVLNGKFYLLAQRAKFQLSNGMHHFDFNKGYVGYKLVTENHPCLKDCRPWDTGIHYNYSKPFDMGSIIGGEDKGYHLSKMVGAPAFTLCDASSHRSPVYVDSLIPNLGELGFGSLFTPEQMYQEIAMFLGNVIRESPDSSPPASVSDKDRLKQKGFDPVTSFRGKVK